MLSQTLRFGLYHVAVVLSFLSSQISLVVISNFFVTYFHCLWE